MNTTTIHLETTTEVVGWIAATVSTVIASANLPGHDLDTVMSRMTTDRVLTAIRTAYITRVQRGDDRNDAIKRLGVCLIAEYYSQLGID